MDVKRVSIGETGFLQGEGELGAYGIGSCIALFIYSKKRHLGGVAHILLPITPEGETPSEKLPAKYADNAVKILNMEMEIEKTPHDFEAYIVGGSTMFESDSQIIQAIGERNMNSVTALLSKLRVKITKNDTGGNYGRSALMDISDGKLTIKTLHHGTYTL